MGEALRQHAGLFRAAVPGGQGGGRPDDEEGAAEHEGEGTGGAAGCSVMFTIRVIELTSMMLFFFLSRTLSYTRAKVYASAVFLTDQLF